MSAVASVPPKSFAVVGHEGVPAAFRAALGSGALHPAWLLTGPRGIGKAQVALQCALIALGAEPGSGPERAAMAGGHPDFLWIGKGEATDIPVSAVQGVVRFFGRRAAMGGVRVVVVDAMDDLNRFGVNAMLKTLEEPPPRSVFLLVHHREKRLLPTVVSRCRRTAMSRLSEQQMREALGDIDPDIAPLLGGRPGRAEYFSDPQVRTCIAAMRRLLSESGGKGRDLDTVLSAASRSAAVIGAVEAVAFAWCEHEAMKATVAAQAAKWAETHAVLGQIREERRELMLDTAQAAAMMLQATKRAARL